MKFISIIFKYKDVFTTRGTIDNQSSVHSIDRLTTFNNDHNHSSQLIELQQLGFEIPESETTNRTSQVDLYVQMWKEGKLFKQYPTDGIVIKINSRKLQKQLGENSVCPNWAFAVKG